MPVKMSKLCAYDQRFRRNGKKALVVKWKTTTRKLPHKNNLMHFLSTGVFASEIYKTVPASLAVKVA